MNQLYKDPDLYFLRDLPTIGYHRPDWLRITDGRFKEATHSHHRPAGSPPAADRRRPIWGIVDGEVRRFPSRLAAREATGIVVDMRVLTELRTRGIYVARQGKHKGAVLANDPEVAQRVLAQGGAS